ncbi:MAG: hypothetical protein ACYSWP_22305 [Planctomycetota bacterium]|jgi:hypothetical protein
MKKIDGVGGMEPRISTDFHGSSLTRSVVVLVALLLLLSFSTVWGDIIIVDDDGVAVLSGGVMAAGTYSGGDGSVGDP